MLRFPSAVLAAVLFLPLRASAQVVSAAASGGASAVSAAAGAAVRAPMAISPMSLPAPSLSIQTFSAAPVFAPALAPSALSAVPAASRAAAVEAALAASAVAPAAAPSAAQAAVPAVAAPSAALAVSGNSAAALTGVFRADAKTAAAPSAAVTETRMNVLFDGAETRRSADESSPVVGSRSSLSAASVLQKSAPLVPVAKAAVPAASRVSSTAKSFAKKALLAVALLLALPGMAMAAPVGGPVITSVTALSYLAGLQPLAAAAGAVIGAVFGMFAARSKDGSPVAAGEVFSSILRYGVLGGAGIYVLLDVTHMAFAGVAASPLQPITTAIATAALGRTAFQDKFTDPATSSADRITGAFPAVAASVGISIATVMGVLAVPAITAATLAVHAMAVTGVATALFAALYKPGQSPVDGPARMAKGFVLQALMMGLALAMSNQLLFAIFAAMGVVGFGLVLWATALELWAHRPGAPAQPLPPAPPVKKDPPAAPPAGSGSTKNLIEQ